MMFCDSFCKEVVNLLFCVNFVKYWQFYYFLLELVYKLIEFFLVFYLNVCLEGLLIFLFIVIFGCEENFIFVCMIMYILVEKGLLKDFVYYELQCWGVYVGV